MKWFTYILQCSDGSLYTGITNDLDKRISTHQSGKASKYTRCRLPVELLHHERKRTKSSALKRELEIKSWPRVKKLALLEKCHPERSEGSKASC